MISVLCPSRGRPELLRRSIRDLLSLAADPSQVEVLVRIDDDDPCENAYRVIGEDCRWIVGKGLGYQGQHVYNNELAARAKGDWLMIWNDDAIMRTKGWDLIISSHTAFELVSLANNQPREYACFPVVPREWFRACGRLSLDCRVDTWLNEVANGAGCFVREDRVYVHHDRHDLTGNNDDEVYRNRYVHPTFYTSFHDQANVEARAADIEAIRKVLHG